jgi:hypothetical protein
MWTHSKDGTLWQFRVRASRGGAGREENDCCSSSNNSDNLPLPVTIYTKSYQLPFNSSWIVCVLHNQSSFCVLFVMRFIWTPLYFFSKSFPYLFLLCVYITVYIYTRFSCIFFMDDAWKHHELLRWLMLKTYKNIPYKL